MILSDSSHQEPIATRHGMRLRRTTNGVEMLAPAKLNLFLEVLGKREDGFHELETLMCPISLYDTLTFTPTKDQAISFKGEMAIGPANEEVLPAGDDNLVVRAVRMFREASGVAAGARIELVKRIPMAAGLGGGSSDAAAALVAANEAWRLRWSAQRLAEIAAQLGSDVPFVLAGGSAVCRGRGERIEPIEGISPLWFVVARPPEGLSTADVYRQCRPSQDPKKVQPLIDALRAGNIHAAARRFHNQLQPAAEELSPWIGRLKDLFSKLDVIGHQMSGSGTSYFALCHHGVHARQVAATLRARGVSQVFAVHAIG